MTYHDEDGASLSEWFALETTAQRRAFYAVFLRAHLRAHAERATAGFIKAIVARNGTIIGATIVGKGAGELILPWVLAVKKKLTVGDMATIIAPYHDRAGRIVGVLGVIGPTRLNYARVIPMVDYTAKLVSRLIG